PWLLRGSGQGHDAAVPADERVDQPGLAGRLSRGSASGQGHREHERDPPCRDPHLNASLAECLAVGFCASSECRACAAHPPSGLAAIRSQKFGRRKPGRVRSSTSEFIVPNVVEGLWAKPSLNARTIPRLKSLRGNAAITASLSAAGISSSPS